MAENEDDDAWLYGDDSAEKDVTSADFLTPGDVKDSGAGEKSKLSAAATPFQGEAPVENQQVTSSDADVAVAPIDKEAGEISGEESEVKAAVQPAVTVNDVDDDDDESDDDVQVTIGDIKTVPPSQYGFGQKRTPYQQKPPESAPGTAQAPGKPTVVIQQTQKTGIDLDGVGAIGDVSIYDFDINTVEDKPWRKPGADITDYFNYGFNEETWIAYCEKQRQLRSLNPQTRVQKKETPVDTILKTVSTNENSKYTGASLAVPKRAGAFYRSAPSGHIEVLGTRRQDESSSISVIGAESAFTPPTTGPPPDMSLPPPGMPVSYPMPGMPPPNDMMLPPPAMGPPPLGYPPPPPGSLPPGYDPYLRYPAPPAAPPTTAYYGNYPPAPYPPVSASATPLPPGWDEPQTDSWEEHENRAFESQRSDRDTTPPFDRYSRDDHETRTRDRERRHRDRERSRDRDRSSTRDRDRDRDRDREREDRHKRKKKREDEDEDGSRRHHKKKKSKKEKPEEDD